MNLLPCLERWIFLETQKGPRLLSRPSVLIALLN
jgi:hypothetical protein